jgi:predicted DNA-binding protein (MmcQ/YjbR family)
MNFDFLSHCEGYRPAPYFANRGMKWIQQIDSEGKRREELEYYLTQSYRIVAGSLSKKRQVELGIDWDSFDCSKVLAFRSCHFSP